LILFTRILYHGGRNEATARAELSPAGCVRRDLARLFLIQNY
jgi:hypothetical protein